jgi:hypothetical protein
LVRIIAAPSAIAAQRLTQVARTAYERHGEVPLVHVILLVGRGEHLGLVDVVHAEALEHLRLDEVTDPALGHDRNGDGLHDLDDLGRVGHARHTAGGPDVGGHALERHDGDSAGVLGYLGLLGVDHVHDHATFEHLGQAGLDQQRTGLLGCVTHCRGSFASDRTGPARRTRG